MTSSLSHSLVVPIVLLVLLSLACHSSGGGLSSEASNSRQQHHTVTRAGTGSAKNSNNRHMALSSLLRRRRSMKGGLWGPPSFNPYFADSSSDSSSLPSKRNEDEAWIWMPAYGYVPMPTDDGSSKDHERAGDRIGNLLRYG